MKISADTYSRLQIGDRVDSGARQFAIILLLCLATFASAGCGKVGDPLPPIPRTPLIIDELSVAQEGTKMVLSIPFSRTPRSPKLERIDIYRLVESPDDPLGLPQEAFSKRATIINSIPGDEIPLSKSITTIDDALDFKAGANSSRYRYAVQLVTSGGAAADFSNYAMVTPLFDLALPPVKLVTKQREAEIEVTWTAPPGNEDGSTTANVAGYNIYRRTGESTNSFVRLNAQPLREARFLDRNFQFGETYVYFVRALSLLPGNASLLNAIESNQSAPLTHTPADTFPPAAPTPITIASIGGIVSLYWPLNSEPDTLGYNIYRAEEEDAPPGNWVKLNPQLHKTTSFRDDLVQVGKQYSYQITAVDAYGNESPRSKAVSETVAP
jgi:hypothetical protein